MKRIPMFFIALFITFASSAQTKDELLSLKAAAQDSLDLFKKRTEAIQGQIDALPGWRFNAFGTVGGSLSGFNNWYGKESPNSSVGNFGFNINASADKIEDKYFWKNAMNLNISWVKSDDKDDPNDSEDYEVATDVLNLSSLYGYKLTKSFAVSAFGEYRTTLVNNFNDPGFLDLGVGGTWTPISELVVVIHPLNYNFVFSSAGVDYQSSLGAKIVADYNKKIGALNIKSNLSVFLSYEDADYSNYTWTNSVNYNVWKNLGLGFDLGLRKNKQEAFNYQKTDNPALELPDADNKLQSYWLFGLTYNLK